MSSSTLKWPLLQTMAPSGMAWKCSLRMMPLLPVTVTKSWPILAASAMVMTSKPSITASSARVGSISVTITRAPAPRARRATPRPTQP